MSNSIAIRFSAIAMLLTAFLFAQCGSGGENYKGDRDAGAARSADSTGSTSSNDYPSDKVEEETNLEPEDDMPMEVSEINSSIERQKLLALLMRQKNDMSYRIEELENMSSDASDNTVVQGDIDKLRLYIGELDQKIVDVRKANAGSMKEAVESALGTIKGAGALLQSTVMRVDRGF